MEIWKVYVINKQEEVKGVIFPHGEMYGSFCLFYYFFWSKWSLSQDMRDHLRI